MNIKRDREKGLKTNTMNEKNTHTHTKKGRDQQKTSCQTKIRCK